MKNIENPALTAMAKNQEPKKAEKAVDFDMAKKLKQETVAMTRGKRLEDLEATELKKVLAKYQEIERVLGIAEEESSPELRAVWQNPETQKEQTIEIDLEKKLDEQKTFYKDRLNLEIDEAKIRSIWKENYAEIKSEMEKYGYDEILILPENLPEEEILNQKLIESMDEGVGKGKVAATWQSDNFKEGGSFAGVKNSYSSEYRIVLTHSIGSIEDHPILKATRSKNVMQVTGLDNIEVDRRIANGEELPVNCEVEINGQKIRIEAEGESLEEYVVQQRMHFDKTGEHLDVKGNSYTRLLKSRSGARVVRAYWFPLDRQLIVCAHDPGYASDDLGLRLSRSFKKLA
jgi:dihydroneopterin aldolase